MNAQNKETPGVGAQGASETNDQSCIADSAYLHAQVNHAHPAVPCGVFNPRMSTVANVRDTTTSEASLGEILRGIRAGKWKSEVETVRCAFLIDDESGNQRKKLLPAVLFSGVFAQRCAKQLRTHSGVICVDLDAKENPSLKTDMVEVRRRIETDSHTLAVFLSPSGSGLKVLIRCDPNRPHSDSFDACRRHFSETFGLRIDEACKDVCRLCFVSYDPDLFSRDDAPLIPYGKLDCGVGAVGSSDSPTSQNAEDAFVPMPEGFGSVTKAQVRHLLQFIPTRPDYGPWLTILSAVFSALPYDDAFEVLNEWSPEEAADEYRDKYVHRLQRVGIGTLFHLAKQKGFTGFPPGLERSHGVKTLPIWSPMQFEFHQPNPSAILLGEGFLQRGEFTSLVGVGGLGKTRLILWLAICQIRGREWCGLPTRGGPLKWLFLCTESSLTRWKNDLGRMLPGLSVAERGDVDANLRILAITPDEEGIINVADPASMRRLEATLLVEQPAVVVIDPFADVVAGDENATADVVHTIREFRKVQRRAAPDAAVIIIHHARTGTANVAQAGDNYAAGNFGRGSKALYSRVRCELQLAPADRDDPKKLVLCCGKANDCEKFQPRGVVFDTENFSYDIDPTFDLETWRRDLDGKKSGSLVSANDVVSGLRDALSGGAVGANEVPAKAVIDLISSQTGASTKTVKRAMAKAAEAGLIKAGSKRGLWAMGPKEIPQ